MLSMFLLAWNNDDAVEFYTLDAINSFLGQRKNPNGHSAQFFFHHDSEA